MPRPGVYSRGSMLGLIARYANWLHTRWPAGTVERLPEVRPDGSTNLPGVYVAGDLKGIPLLKFALDTGARAARAIARDLSGPGGPAQSDRAADPTLLDLVIIGAGVSGVAAAAEAKRLGLSYTILEATEPFTTILNFPKGKPIYTYPKTMTSVGGLQVSAEVKEALVDELRRQADAAGIRPDAARAARIERAGGALTVHLEEGAPLRGPLRARRVLVAIGQSGNFRKLGVSGEERDKVYNRLHDPNDFSGKRALVVGGGDTALETAIVLVQAGAHVTLSYRKEAFSRPKAENIEK